MTLAHMVTQQVVAPAEAAFRFMADPLSLGRWSLGCFDTHPDASAEVGAAGLHTGRSLFDGSRVWFRIEADAALRTIDYLVGAPDALVRRISARIMDGPALGYGAATCLVSLIAWRPAEQDDLRWARLCACHEAEIHLIKAQIEARPWIG